MRTGLFYEEPKKFAGGRRRDVIALRGVYIASWSWRIAWTGYSY